MAEPVPPLLAFAAGIQQQIERDIGHRQCPPQITEHLEAVMALHPIARWMCAAMAGIRCSIDGRVLVTIPLCSVVVRAEHGCDRPLPLTADVVGDDPDRAVLAGGVAGEKAAVAAAGCVVVGGLVVLGDGALEREG
jgi:hypothetical protein